MDVQMEDADTQSHQQLDNVKASQDGTPDDPELKLGLSPQLPPAHESKNFPPEDLNDPQIHKEGAHIELGDQKQIQTHHSEKENKPFAEAKEKDTIAKGDDDHQEHTNAAEDETETKTKDQTDFKSAVKEQSPRENNKDAKDTLNSTVGGKSPSKVAEDDEEAKNHTHNGQLPFQLPVSEVPPKKKEDAHQGESEEMFKEPTEEVHQSKTEGLVKKEPENKSLLLAAVSHDKTVTKATKPEVGDSPLGNKRQPATPDFPLKYSSRRSAGHSDETIKNVFNDSKMSENDDGTPEQQAAFIKELENFYRQRGTEFKPPKFYGQPLNCYKLWTSVIKLGGYDLVTGTKLWRQVGESFHPPKTCTTVSWTFRIFYEKSLLEYERYKVQNGEVELPAAALPEPSGADNEGNGYQASGSGRARRDAAARAMQGWHAQRLFGYGEDKSPNNMQKRENKLKSIGSLKQKRPNEAELPVKAQKTETFKQLVTTVVDVGPPADWVKINVRETKDCFEVYALVPGLLREEVRVQSDPAGRLVITGQPEQTDNPWGITAFKKVVNLPARIDPLQTSAVVSLHGRLFVRVPFEQSNI